MSYRLATRRHRVGSMLAAALVGGIGVLVAAPQAAVADTIPAMTITTVTPAKVPADISNRVVTITGTGFDEDYISKIALGADVACASLTNYVVVSATSISLKTPSGGCNASVDGIAETVTIYDQQTTPGITFKATAITFVPPPKLVLGANDATTPDKPVVTENSSGLGLANQVNELKTLGNQVIRVKAASDYVFSGATVNGLTATLGTKPLTGIKVYKKTDGTAAGTVALTDAENGNWFTAITPTGLTVTGGYSLVITQNGVSASFSALYTGLTWSSAPTVTSLDVTSGKASGGTVVKITGTGFNTGAEVAVLFCGLSVVPSPATATLLTVTTPFAAGDADGLGATTYEGICPVRVKNTGTNIGTSVVTDKSYFVYLTN